MEKEKTKIKAKDIVFYVIAGLFCVFFGFIIIVNGTLLIKSWTNKDEVPSIFGNTPVAVSSGSMYPTIQAGDLIVTKKINPKDVKIGDIICFFDPEGDGTQLNTHRVVDKKLEGEKYFFQTQGDANNIVDAEWVEGDKIVGKYYNRFAGIGDFIMFFQTPWGLLIMFAIPISVFVLTEVYVRKRKNQEDLQEKEALKKEIEKLKAEKNQEFKTELSDQEIKTKSFDVSEKSKISGETKKKSSSDSAKGNGKKKSSASNAVTKKKVTKSTKQKSENNKK